MQIVRRGIRLFRAFGVSVHLDYSWFIFFLLVVWTLGRFYFPHHLQRFGAAESWMLATTAAILLLFSVIFHEMSHAVTSNRYGTSVKRITLFIFGGIAHMHKEPDEPRTEFLVAGAGPVSSLVLWVAFGLSARAFGELNFPAVEALFGLVSQLNLILAIFNMVPGFPLDGGRLLRAALWWKMRSFRRATNIAAKTGEGFGYILMLIGVLTLFRSNSLTGFIGGVWYILIGIFLRMAAEKSYQSVLMEDVLDGILVCDVMGKNVLSVHQGDSVESLVEGTFLHHKFTVYPVIDDDEQVVGVIDLSDVRKVPREQRDRITVFDLMRRVPNERLPRLTTEAMSALRDMLSLGMHRLPVVDDSGRLAGIITRSDIMSMFQIRNELVDEVV